MRRKRDGLDNGLKEETAEVKLTTSHTLMINDRCQLADSVHVGARMDLVGIHHTWASPPGVDSWLTKEGGTWW